MNLVKIIGSSFSKLFSRTMKRKRLQQEPRRKLSNFGCLLELEARRKKSALLEQKNNLG